MSISSLHRLFNQENMCPEKSAGVSSYFHQQSPHEQDWPDLLEMLNNGLTRPTSKSSKPQANRRRTPGKAAGGSSLNHQQGRQHKWPVLGDILNDIDNERRRTSRINKPKKGFIKAALHTRKNNVQASKHVKARTQMLTKPMPMDIAATVDEIPMVVEQRQQVCRREEQCRRVPPIQHNHTLDIFSFPEYTKDIYRYLRKTESLYKPKFNYMAMQTDITHSMRTILVDWLVEVSEEYKLNTETLHLAVNYIDRFLSYMSVERSKLQLVAVACMFIAVKYEEIYHPKLGQFVDVTDNSFTKHQVLRMELLVLKVLNFDLAVPTTHLFIQKILEVDRTESPIVKVLNAYANYLSELALVDGQRFLRHPPSLMAASSVALARITFGLSIWTEQHAVKSGYSLEDMTQCLTSLHATALAQSDASPQTAVRTKYKSAKFYGVSGLGPPQMLHYVQN